MSVRHPLLYGEYELTLDDKKRLAVPAEVRRSIPPEFGDSLYCVPGINGVPWLYAERYYSELAMQRPSDMMPDDDLHAYEQMVFSLAARLPIDKQNRVLLPERLVREAELGKDVTLIGVKDHLELWPRARWEERRAELRSRQAEIFNRARQQSRQPAPPTPGGSQG